MRHIIVSHGLAYRAYEVLDMPINHITARLPHRQRQVLELFKDGFSEKQIAVELKISRETVHVFAKALYKRLAVHTRGELLRLFIRRPNRK